MDANGERQLSWMKAGCSFALMFIVYQAAEGLQTRIAPGSPLGPALMILALALGWPLGRWLGGRGYDAFGLVLTRGWWAVLIGGMMLAVLAKLASLAIGWRAGIYTISTTSADVTAAGVGFVLLSTFIPSVAEDILTRGFLLRAVPVRLGFWQYTVGTALLYTANHLWRLDWGLSEQLRLFCLGLAYGAAAWRWRTLWAAVALHWGWNLSNGLADQALPLDTANMVAGRMVSGGAHLVLLALVLLFVPARREVSR